METTAGFVLCGGRSQRMGRDKALLPYGPGSLVEHMARLVESVAGSATLVGAPERYGHLGYPVLADESAECGPLAGLVTLIAASEADLNVVVPCDMPAIDRGFVLRMIEAARLDPTCSAVVPLTSSGTHPLSAVYRKSALGSFRTRLAAGQLRVRDALNDLKIREIPAEAELLANVNTPADWVRFAHA